MGFLDALLGRSRTAKPAKKDRLFAMSTAYVTLQVQQPQNIDIPKNIVFTVICTFSPPTANGPVNPNTVTCPGYRNP